MLKTQQPTYTHPTVPAYGLLSRRGAENYFFNRYFRRKISSWLYVSCAARHLLEVSQA